MLKKIKAEVEKITGRKNYRVEFDGHVWFFIDNETGENFANYNSKKSQLIIF